MRWRCGRLDTGALPEQSLLVISAFGKSAQDARGMCRRSGQNKEGKGGEEEEELMVKIRKTGGRKESEAQRKLELTL